MQTKLTQEQISNCRNIARLLGNGTLAFGWWDTEEGSDYWMEVFDKLREKIHHGTSDGKPYVEPDPPIPEGWRKALDNEHCRKDVKLWDKDKKKWAKRLFPSQPFLNGDRYIVPIDKPLTDEDACVWPRRLVMVRDDETQEWQGPYRYLGKNDYYPYPYIVESDGNHSRVWRYARQATPEEIEAAK